jgi:Ca-activated chloride channel family protein
VLTASTQRDSRSRASRTIGLVALGLAGIMVLLSVGAAGYLWVNRAGADCSGDQVTTTVAASPDQFPVMSELANRWNADVQPDSDRCVRVAVQSVEPSKVAAALGPAWDEARDGARPDVWAPDSAAWTLVAGARQGARPLLPTRAPSIAQSAIVLALPRPMAEAMGWPKRQVRMPDLLGAMAAGKTWASFGHPEWGAIRFGMTDPTRSAAALNVLISILDRDADRKLSNAELTASVAFTGSVTKFAATAEELFDAASLADPKQALKSAVIFPTDEFDLASNRASSPELDFVPIYLGDQATFADHPYAILDAPWVDETKYRTAANFRDYLLSAEGQRAYGGAGFRDTTGTARPGPLLDRGRGFATTLQNRAQLPDAQSVNQIIAQWSLLQRPINVLIVLDTSGSMNERIPQLNATRLQLLQQAAVKGIGLLNSVSSMSLWQFSSKLTPTTDYRELVPLGLATGKVGAVSRRDALVAAIQGLRAGGGTGLYDTTAAAYAAMQKAWQPDAVNMVMVITDGKNEDDAGLSQDQLLAQLRTITRADRPTPILGIAVGPEADAAAMQRISQITGGRTFPAKSDKQVLEQIVLAFAGRLR